MGGPRGDHAYKAIARAPAIGSSNRCGGPCRRTLRKPEDIARLVKDSADIDVLVTMPSDIPGRLDRQDR